MARAITTEKRNRILRLSWAQQDRILGYIFITPMLLFFFGLIAYPLISAIHLSLTDRTVASGGDFIGLENFIDLLQLPLFKQTIVNTVQYAGSAVLLKTMFGLIVALVLHQKFKGRDLARGLVFTPWVAPMIVAGIAMRWMFDDLFGVINNALEAMGAIEWPISWLGDKLRAKIVVIISAVWKGMPFYTMSFLAGLQTIPPEYYEAAAIDGANVWQRFRYITLPSISGIILLVVSLSSIWTVNDFATIYIITGGGPASATETVATLTYRMAFEYLQLAKAVAVSLLFLPIFLLLLFIATRAILGEESG